MNLDVTTLSRVSPLLDELLDLEGQQREEWLAKLAREQPEVAELLKTVLMNQRKVETNDILERGPNFDYSSDSHSYSDFSVGDTIGPYTLVRVIGTGGMGEVWLAERADGALKRELALKLPMISLKRSVLLQRFERERDILASLTHPNIARLYDAGLTSSGQPYLALEYVKGSPIVDYANKHALDARARVDLLVQAMAAVQFAHSNLVIHRDLKPGNILVTEEGHVQLLDFGISKLLADNSNQIDETELTQIGGRALTLQYAAPEQVMGLPIGISVDVWALGVLLYEILSDKRPFDLGVRASIENAVIHSDPVAPSKHKTGTMSNLSKSLASDLDTIILKALKKNPAERYETVVALSDDLKRWLKGEAVLAQAESNWYRVRKFVGRHQLAVISGAIASFTIVAIAVIAVAQSLKATEQSARAIAGREFLINMFRQADPDLANGKVIAADQLLDQARETLEKTMAKEPKLQTDLFRGIGEAMVSMKEYEKADSAYASAVENLLKLGEPREAAMVLLDRVRIAQSLQGNASRAENLLAEVDRIYAAPRDDEFMAMYWTSRAYLAYLQGNGALIREVAIKATPFVDRAFKNSASTRAVQSIQILAGIERYLNRNSAAIERLSTLSARLEASGLEHPTDMLQVLADLAQAESADGRYRSAMSRFQKAASICERSLNPNGMQCAKLRHFQILTLLRLGFKQDAMKALPLQLDGFEGHLKFEFMLAAYRALVASGKLDEYPSVDAYIKNYEFSQAGKQQSAAHLLRLAQVRTLCALQLGRTDEADEHLRKTQSRFSSAIGKSKEIQAQTHLYIGLVAESRGQYVEAQELISRAVDELAQTKGADHPLTLLISANLARVLGATNRRDEAIALLDRAIPTLSAAMGKDAPTFQRVLTLRDDLAGEKASGTPARKKIEVFY